MYQKISPAAIMPITAAACFMVEGVLFVFIVMGFVGGGLVGSLFTIVFLVVVMDSTNSSGNDKPEGGKGKRCCAVTNSG